jgi:hypothetical protein
MIVLQMSTRVIGGGSCDERGAPTCGQVSVGGVTTAHLGLSVSTGGVSVTGASTISGSVTVSMCELTCRSWHNC